MNNTYKPIGYWLLLGILTIYIQIIIGGITRLTGSGLSITEWEPIMGAIPPLNDAQWHVAFEKYKRIPQYEVLNRNMTLSGFKSIFFWEWFHRLWARVALALVFITGLTYFLIKGKINKPLLIKLLGLFILGGLEGLMGWIMVQSGLKDNIWVNHLKLTLHLLLALTIIAYLLWLALDYVLPKTVYKQYRPLQRYSRVMLGLVILQIAYGGIMAGLKAALAYNTWPMFGMQWIPDVDPTQTWLYNAVNDKAMVQLIHRSLAYVIVFAGLFYAYMGFKHADTRLKNLFLIYPFIILLQITIGVMVLINTPTGNPSMPIPVFYGVSHQIIGIFTYLYTLLMCYVNRGSKIAAAMPVAV